ncbi:MAG: DUF6106 family protein [Ruminococcus flavefaciens]|nr:DUF6106 family protein [Ruminococcus flavefaciens]
MLNMNDDYAEFSVESKNKHTNVGVVVLTIILAIVVLLLVLLINGMLPQNIRMLGSLLIAAYLIVGIPLFISICHAKSVDYDYLYVENDLDIDMVISKSKRKHVLTVHMEHAKRIAPMGSQSILGYEGKGNVMVKDYSSGESNPYVIVVEKNGTVVELLIEPDEHMLSLMKQRNKDIFYEE